MKKNSDTFPEFENPPVVEVVCNLLFQHLDKLLVPHIGLFWERIISEYPECKEMDPIFPSIENFDDKRRVNTKASDIPFPSFPRVWFIERKSNRIIQIQKDRFIFNWRKIREDDEYPRYKFVLKEFKKHLAMFKKFIGEYSIGTLSPRQYEMTYINHIPKGEGWDSLADIANIFPDFAWKKNDNRFLPDTQGLNCQIRFTLPHDVGRLHIKIQDGYNVDREHVLTLELRVRGIGEFTSVHLLENWFDIAHEWIVKGFVDITSDEIQNKIWGRLR